MQKITPHLWFDTQAEEAVNVYTSLFKNSRIISTARYGKEGAEISGQPEGSVMTITFELEGQEFMALNGGPVFTFSPAISFLVKCESQEEIDRLWGELSREGTAEPCGWLRDTYGVSWQIVPTALGEMMQGADPKKTERVMAALLQMKKIDIATLKKAYEE